MVAMVLWHRAGMSSTLGGSLSWRTSVAFVWMGVVVWVSGVGRVLVDGLGVVDWAEFLRRVMRLICLVSDLGIRGIVYRFRS